LADDKAIGAGGVDDVASAALVEGRIAGAVADVFAAAGADRERATGQDEDGDSAAGNIGAVAGADEQAVGAAANDGVRATILDELCFVDAEVADVFAAGDGQGGASAQAIAGADRIAALQVQRAGNVAPTALVERSGAKTD